jgi:hypothetical protein
MPLTLQQRLEEAETAYHRLQIGESAAEVRDSNGESVRYTQANVGRLRSYIADLKAEIAAVAAGTPQRRGPLNPVFG